jgi:hypothetical protein
MRDKRFKRKPKNDSEQKGKTFVKTTAEGKWLYWVEKNKDGFSYISAVKRLV